MPIIATTSPTFASVGDTAKRIRAAGFDLERHTETDTAYADTLARADYLVAGLLPVTADTIAAAPHLKGILKHGVGLDSIDIPAATARGIPVTSTPGANAQAVAEMALGAIFALSRNTVFGHSSVTTGQWQRKRGREVAGTTLGLIGFGQIGQRLARMARGVGMDVLAYDPYPEEAVAAELSVELTQIDDVLSRADVVSLHLPGSPETDNLVNATAIATMKPGALILNFARGTIVDLDALADALHSGHLAGAAIDAYPVEPPDTAQKIFSAPNVLFSPHSGADTAQSIGRMSEMVFEDIQTLHTGEIPRRAVNQAAIAGES